MQVPPCRTACSNLYTIENEVLLLAKYWYFSSIHTKKKKLVLFCFTKLCKNNINFFILQKKNATDTGLGYGANPTQTYNIPEHITALDAFIVRQNVLISGIILKTTTKL